MKELSVEEKAKLYDEAKARMSRAYNDNRCTIGFMNEIFPELKESDGERIRKKLVQFFKEKDEEDFEEWVPKAKVLAWLEKQGEQKPVEWSEEDEKCLITITHEIQANKREAKSSEHKVYDMLIDWLKSIKDRVQPQSQWKPSDEQMDALDDFIYAKYPNIEKYGAVVKLLYQDLKKLREE